MKRMKKFTLIEVLVVVAIIGILASLLLPALGEARKKSRAAVCVSNLKQVSVAFYMYADDNNNTIISSSPSAGDWSWDEKLSEDYIGGTGQVFWCPADSLQNNWNTSDWRRTYGGISGENWTDGVCFVGSAVSLTDVGNPADTFMVGERPDDKNSYGRVTKARLIKPSQQYFTDLDDLHGADKFSYLHVDGHVRLKNTYGTFGEGDFDAPLGSWTRASDD
jgi:prepilin-type N-terminal cleavage/methylation domain-containing protein